jgi:hypothetical protein
MSNFAKIENGNVLEILAVPENFSDQGSSYLSLQLGLGGNWIKTPRSNGTEAAIGGTYSETEDAFIPPKPDGNKWQLNENYQWILPLSNFASDSPPAPPR